MFWKFAPMISQIDTLLERDDVTLFEVLEEEDVIQECKGCNKNLINYLTDADRLESLLRLMLEDPASEVDEKSRYKFANIACELLTCDVSEMNSALVVDDRYLDILYDFLNVEPPLNPLSASFFMKVMVILINKKPTRLIAYLRGKDNFLDNLLAHLGTSAIMDLLLRLIGVMEVTDADSGTKVVDWLADCGLVSRLLRSFECVDGVSAEQAADKHCNAALVLCDLVSTVREQMTQNQNSQDSNRLFDTLVNEETLSALLGTVLDCPERSESSLSGVLSVLQAILNRRKNEVAIELVTQTPSELDLQRLRSSALHVVRAITPNIKLFCEVLERPPKQFFNVMPTSIGELNPPLGNTRLQVCHLFLCVLTVNAECGNAALCQHNVLRSMFDLFFQYPFNTFLHSIVELAVTAVIFNSPPSSCGQQHLNLNNDCNSDATLSPPAATCSLLRQLLIDCDLPGRIVNSCGEIDATRRRHGYFGHIFRMANCLNDNLSNGPNKKSIEQLFQELDADLVAKWNLFVKGALMIYNKTNTIETGHLGTGFVSSSDDDDADFQNISFPSSIPHQQLQHAFTEYQDQKLTAPFVEPFGFQEDEFHEATDKMNGLFSDRVSSIDFSLGTPEDTANATTFEQACNEQIRQFDDPLNDENEDISSNQLFHIEQQSQELAARYMQQGGDDEDEDASSSDEDDLHSPMVVRSRACVIETNLADVDVETCMEVEDDECIDDVGVAMDTTPVAWHCATDTANQVLSPDGTATNFEVDWADFGNMSDDKQEFHFSDQSATQLGEDTSHSAAATFESRSSTDFSRSADFIADEEAVHMKVDQDRELEVISHQSASSNQALKENCSISSLADNSTSSLSTLVNGPSTDADCR